MTDTDENSGPVTHYHQYWLNLQVFNFGNNIMNIRNMCSNSGMVVLAWSYFEKPNPVWETFNCTLPDLSWIKRFRFSAGIQAKLSNISSLYSTRKYRALNLKKAP